ncbi:MAG: rod shape-determining protein RodA, partial [Zymomonas mobilis subsp. pomaceae]
MLSMVPTPLRQLPWGLLLLVIAIGSFGLVILYSAGGGMHPWALNQGLRFIFFIFVSVAISRIDQDFLKKTAWPLYGGLLLLLIAVELFGFVGGGSRRWLNLGILTLQPSELMKLAIILAIARFYDLLPAGETRSFSAMWPAAVLVLVPAFLVAIQPDLGTALMIIGGGLIVTFLAGLPLWLFIGGGAAIAALAPFAFFFLLHDYQRNRVLIFLTPESDPLGRGYHISQSKIAIGSGGVFGKGFLNGTQSHLDYLPERHTDFVFATMAEEWGLIGGLFIIVSFMLIINWGMRVAFNAPSRFAKLTAAGLSTTIFFYVAINLAMVMGLAPVVGIPLPLVSNGGSAMMTVMICLGLLMAIDRWTRFPK